MLNKRAKVVLSYSCGIRSPFPSGERMDSLFQRAIKIKIICFLVAVFFSILIANTLISADDTVIDASYLIRTFSMRHAINDSLIELTDFEVANVIMEIAREIGYEVDSIKVVRRPRRYELIPPKGWDTPVPIIPYEYFLGFITPRPYDIHVYITYGE